MVSTRNNLSMELAVYSVVWISAVIYSIYRFAHSANKHFRFYNDEYSDFVEGWFQSTRKDNSDEEWKNMKLLIQKVAPWVILSTAISEILRTFKLPKIIHLWQIFIALSFILKELGSVSLILLLIQPISFAVVLSQRSKFLIWLCSLLNLSLVLLFDKYKNREDFVSLTNINEQTGYLTLISLCWCNLRCLSYSLDFLEGKKSKLRFVKFLSYSFYLPNLVGGPFIPYSDFKGCYQTCGNFQKRVFQVIKDVSRFLFWLLFTELCLHFIYVNAILFHPMWVRSFDSWSLYGYGYTMGQFFHLKYFVVYGLALSFAKFENIKVPTLPICIGRVYLYSDMWKYFDAGLYTFLLKYIYIPLDKGGIIKNRLISSFVCFAFVFIWHGCQYFVMIWSFLNYVGIVIEYLTKRINKSYLQNSQLYKKLGGVWIRRLSCLTASPLLAMSAIANFYFFAGDEIGYIFVSKFLSEIKSTFILLIILYTCCQVSEELRINQIQGNKSKQK